jgi:hypothetical protein
LIPGGTYRMGAQSMAPGAPNFDDWAAANEGPVREVEIAAFFLSKYELTRGQWLRLTGSLDELGKRAHDAGGFVGDTHPVEQVGHEVCSRMLTQHGLVLPTEAQWERACRAATSTPWSTGPTRGTLEGFVNLLDWTGTNQPPKWPGGESFDDHFKASAPVGMFQQVVSGHGKVHPPGGTVSPKQPGNAIPVWFPPEQFTAARDRVGCGNLDPSGPGELREAGFAHRSVGRTRGNGVGEGITAEDGEGRIDSIADVAHSRADVISDAASKTQIDGDSSPTCDGVRELHGDHHHLLRGKILHRDWVLGQTWGGLGFEMPVQEQGDPTTGIGGLVSERDSGPALESSPIEVQREIQFVALRSHAAIVAGTGR